MTATGFGVQLFGVSATSPVNWRLLSGNNRECGRGVGGFADVERCRDAVARLQEHLGSAASRNRRDGNRWLWDVELDGECVARAGHSFDRLVRCEQAARQFLDEFLTAPLRTGILLSGTRRWGSVAS